MPVVPEPAGRKVYGVSELTARIKGLLETDIGSVWVEGEVSGARTSSLGYVYFDLKDETSLLHVVCFRAPAAEKARIRDGAKIRVWGEVTVYEPRGQYQLIARRIEDAGFGDLMRKFEELKARLQAEGLFDPARKKRLPLLPRTIGIVTSPSGAVIRDILNILGRRYPDRRILLAPARVQGAGAAEEIAAAIDLLNKLGIVDVIIVGRGGGSLEDLWAFNEEVVARAVARSRIPIISAVGHETDFTICDFVADLRAPTPSAAAELVVKPKKEFEEMMRVIRHRLAQALRSHVLALRNRYVRAARSYVFREPHNLIARRHEALTRARERMRHALKAAVTRARQRADEAELRMTHLATLRLQQAKHRKDRVEQMLGALDPRRVLARGYSITYGPAGHPLSDAAEVPRGTRLRTVLARGEVWSETIDPPQESEHE